MKLLPMLLMSLAATGQVANHSPAAERDFESKVHETLEALAREHSPFPPAAATDEDSRTVYQDVQTCKKAIRGLMEACEGADPRARQIRRRILCRAFSECLEQPGEFRFFEYYIVWLGAPLIGETPKYWRSIAGSLVKKIDDALTKASMDESEAVACAAAIRLLLAITEYDGRIFRDGDEIERQEWPSFKEWLQNVFRDSDRLKDSPEGYAAAVRSVITEIESKFATIPNPKNDFESDEKRDKFYNNYRAKLISLLLSGDSEIRQGVLVQQLTRSLVRSPRFRLCDYYMTWKGAPLFRQRRRDCKPVLKALVAKLSRRDEVSGDREFIHMMCFVSIDLLSTLVKWDESLFGDGFEIDWARWDAFSNWFDANYDRLQFDPAEQLYVARPRDPSD